LIKTRHKIFIMIKGKILKTTIVSKKYNKETN